ncbi:MAG: hypothetical protein QNK37_30445 [Acidobacteriota bacterium]|nr:hypothetical protein [Acidobacteriota bacterium]
MTKSFSAFLSALCLCNLPLAAQDFEITPYVGYQFLGDLEVYGFDNGLPTDEISVDDSETYGIILDFTTWDGGQIELVWSHQESEVELEDFFRAHPKVDISIDYFQIGGLQIFSEDDAKVRPFIAGSLGAAYIDPGSGFGNTTRLSLHLGGGVKFFLSDRVAFRVDGKFKSTFIDASVDLYCDPFFCFGYVENSSWFYQMEGTAGLTFAF